MREDQEHAVSVLDPEQAVRIAAMHGGFLYQHLYTVGCLFQAAGAGVIAVVVERDEDVEVILPSGRIYVQVKTRAQSLIPSDIGSALARFQQLRIEHEQGRRRGTAHFVIVTNCPLGPSLAMSVRDGRLGADVDVLIPGQQPPARLSALPPAWSGLDDALRWCAERAATVPHAMLAPDSLVWKLAGLVTSAATGRMQPGGSVFQVGTLPQLFEQLLVQLQDFPAPLPSYSPQIDEPNLDGEARLRLICGFSGAGKTSWVSQAAVHTTRECVYFNASDTPGTALASSLVREVAAGMLPAAPEVLRQVLLPGASGIDSWRALDRYLSDQARSVLVVIDNAHQVPADSIHAVIRATEGMGFLLLCQPTGSTREVEALLGINRETLRGWDLDTVASKVVAAGAHGGAAAMGRLSQQTAGMPLFVQSAARIAVRDYGGDIRELSAALDAQTNLGETAQEVILARTFDGLAASTKDVIAVLSLTDVVLSLEEINQLLLAALEMGAPAIASVLRVLRSLGIVEVFGGQRLKIHDAMRLLGMRHLELLAPEWAQRARYSLKELLFESLTKRQDPTRFSLYVRTLVALNQIEVIIEFAGDEMFHEMGMGDVFLASLETAAASTEIDPAQRFWALDGIAFAQLKVRELESLPQRLDRMQALVDAHALPDEAWLALAMKRMLLCAEHRDLTGVRALIAELGRRMPGSALHQRIFKYNSAIALWRCNKPQEAERLIEEVIPASCRAMGISEAWLFGKSLTQLRPLLERENSLDDVKRLADALEMRSILHKDRQADPGLSRLFAMKLYSLIGAVDSAVRVGQDAADDHVWRHDFFSAREVLEQYVIPYAKHYRMLDRIVGIRSQYAVILAYCRDFVAADAEMVHLDAYAGGFSAAQRQEINKQRGLIAELRAGRGPLQRNPAMLQPMQAGVPRIPSPRARVGRNDQCPCGSGQKFKKCHGR